MLAEVVSVSVLVLIVKAYQIVSGSCSSRPTCWASWSGAMDRILWNVAVRKILVQFARGEEVSGRMWEV